ncbi:WavE lipopolysaccharide synthesis family protein [Candidatus Pelagibacter sp.]|nr:WavE lipopolysaccharide synthesis family protein [Candidatus Pelagibacter sp.]|tara:strand:- start:2483 stop:3661 length:1179 start_codon:yes stop_codon:yes gene_type:complete
MSIKQLLKEKLGKKYNKLRLKYILNKIFGDFYVVARKNIKKFNSKLNFYKNNLNKKVEFQRIVKKETGFIIDRTKDNYLTFHLRPKNSKDFNLESTCKIDEKIAIIIQGPIQEKFNFLKNTLAIYKKIFKNSIIIISTWDNENIKLINSLKEEGIHVLFNKEPKNSLKNIDHQIQSTNIALNFALELGAKYSLKTRADVRLNKNNLETFLISLIQTFPVHENDFVKSRIIVPSLITFKFRIYSLSDIVMFAETEDLIKYFDKESFEVGLKKFDLSKNNLLKNETPIVAEIFLCSRFINKLEGKISWELKDWWGVLKKYFCIIDNSSLDLFWNKYDLEYEYRYLRTYSDKFARAVDFQDWLSLYNGQENNWHLSSNEHEKYDEFLKLKNIYKN